MYFVTAKGLTIMRNTLLGTIALNGDQLSKGTIHYVLQLTLFHQCALARSIDAREIWSTGCCNTRPIPKGKPPTTCGTEAPLLPDVPRDVPDETDKALGCLVAAIFLDVTTSPVHVQVNAQPETLACEE